MFWLWLLKVSHSPRCVCHPGCHYCWRTRHPCQHNIPCSNQYIGTKLRSWLMIVRPENGSGASTLISALVFLPFESTSSRWWFVRCFYPTNVTVSTSDFHSISATVVHLCSRPTSVLFRLTYSFVSAEQLGHHEEAYRHPVLIIMLWEVLI